MSGRQWQPGDVAMVEVHGIEHVAMRNVNSWVYAYNNGSTENYDRSGEVTPLRPLLVIDPENEDDTSDLGIYLRQHGWTTNDSGWSNTAEALRAMIRDRTKPPAPPKPDEPGIWGVVEASCVHTDTRRKWVRHEDGNWWPAHEYGSSDKSSTALPDDWDSLDKPVVIRPGITPDDPEAESDLPPDLIDGDNWVWRWSTSGQGYSMNPNMRASTRAEVERIYGPVREVPHNTGVRP